MASFGGWNCFLLAVVTLCFVQYKPNLNQNIAEVGICE